MYSPRAHIGPLNRNTETAQPEGMHTTAGGSTNNTVTHRYPTVQVACTINTIDWKQLEAVIQPIYN